MNPRTLRTVLLLVLVGLVAAIVASLRALPTATTPETAAGRVAGPHDRPRLPQLQGGQER
jgi:hypothetical protein